MKDDLDGMLVTDVLHKDHQDAYETTSLRSFENTSMSLCNSNHMCDSIVSWSYIGSMIFFNSVNKDFSV